MTTVHIRTILAIGLLAILTAWILAPATTVLARPGGDDNDKRDGQVKAKHGDRKEKEARDDRRDDRRDGAGHRDDDDAPRPNRGEERKLRVTAAGNVATIRAKLEAAGRESQVFLQIRTVRAVELALHVKTETKMADEEREEQLTVSTAFLALVEFTDVNANGVFDANDTVVQRLDLQRLTFTSPTATPVNATRGGQGFRLATHSTGAFRFEVTADMFPDVALVNGTRFGPTATKITIIVDGFPYRANTTLLALQVRAESTMKSEVETRDTETQIRVRSDIAEGFFTWEPTVLADGANRPVRSSITRDQTRALINLVYPHAKRLVHDPLLGIDLRPTLLSLLSGLGTGAILAGIAITTVVLTMRRITR